MPLKLIDTTSTQSFTKPPPRFTEASLVKELERLGIGRPSTYASIMNKIQSRDYTLKENGALKPTELGKVICQMLEENFPPVMDVTFTAQMEDQLEQIAEHQRDWKELIRGFWEYFEPLVEKAEKDAVVPKVMTDLDCPKCGHKLQKIWARSKYFYGCSNYPDCDYTTPIEALEFKKEDYAADFDYEQPCPECSSPMTLRFGKFGPFLGCSRYPDCRGIVNIPKKGEIVYHVEDLPKCPAIGCEGHITQRKSRFGKTFFSCSAYPDCDVISSTLEELPTKYPNHPKTAYVKKRGAKKGSSKTKKGDKTSSRRSFPDVTPSADLAAIIGPESLPRSEATKKLWDYIKANKLQNPKDKRVIMPDAKLAKVIGKEPVNMMKLAGLLSKHLK